MKIKKRKKKNWLTDEFVKESVSNKTLVGKWIIEIGENIVEDMLREKFVRMIKKSNRDGI